MKSLSIIKVFAYHDLQFMISKTSQMNKNIFKETRKHNIWAPDILGSFAFKTLAMRLKLEKR